jgi:hypothetical protein
METHLRYTQSPEAVAKRQKDYGPGDGVKEQYSRPRMLFALPV